MILNNFLSVSANYYSFATPTVSGLTKLIADFINIFPYIWIGVLVFSFALRLVSFPLDFYSRAAMRKNSLKMEKLRPQLEKLQKQYANNKQLYSQKMMSLYKKEGINMFSSCLPTILTLVFFIIVLNSFSQFSYYQNVKYLYNMNTSYNSLIDKGMEDYDGYIWHNEEGKIVIDDYKIYNELNGESGNIESLVVTYSTDSVTYELESGYVRLKKTMIIDGENVSFSAPLSSQEIKRDEFLATGNFDSEYQAFLTSRSLTDTDENLEAFIEDYQQTLSANKYRSEKQGFLWVQNVWMPDTSTQHPVYSTYAEFDKAYKLSKYTTDAHQYDNLTAKLDFEKGTPNGYFILVALTAGSSLLLQFVMGRSQKAQMELQSVDGQGKSQQKMMMWIMPIMMAFFAFMYTSAFSLYIIMSSLSSLLTTLLINKIVDIQIKRQEKKEEQNTVYRK